MQLKLNNTMPEPSYDILHQQSVRLANTERAILRPSESIIYRGLAPMYRESARYYDEIYSYKDYKKEAEKIHRIIRKYKTNLGNSLLRSEERRVGKRVNSLM